LFQDYVDIVGESVDTVIDCADSCLGIVAKDVVLQNLTIKSTSNKTILIVADSNAKKQVTFENCTLVCDQDQSSSCVVHIESSSTAQTEPMQVNFLNNQYILNVSTIVVDYLCIFRDSASSGHFPGTRVCVDGANSLIQFKNDFTGGTVSLSNHQYGADLARKSRIDFDIKNVSCTILVQKSTQCTFCVHQIRNPTSFSNTLESIANLNSNNVQFEVESNASSDSILVGGICIYESGCVPTLAMVNTNMILKNSFLDSNNIYSGQCSTTSSTATTFPVLNVIDAKFDTLFTPRRYKSISPNLDSVFYFSSQNANGTRASNGGLQLNTVTIQKNLTFSYDIGSDPYATDCDSTILVDNTSLVETSIVTVNLPNQSFSMVKPSFQMGRMYTIKSIGLGRVVIDASDTITIDGQLGTRELCYNESVTLQSDGSNWRLIHDYKVKRCLPGNYVLSCSTNLQGAVVSTELPDRSQNYGIVHTSASVLVLDKSSVSAPILGSSTALVGDATQSLLWKKGASTSFMDQYWTCIAGQNFYSANINSPTTTTPLTVTFFTVTTTNTLVDFDIFENDCIALSKVQNQLYKLDLSNILSPSISASTLIDPNYIVRNVKIANGHSYVSQQDVTTGRIQIFDTSLSVVGNFVFNGFIPGPIQRHPTLNLLYISSAVNNSYVVMDIGNPILPIEVYRSRIHGSVVPQIGSWRFFTKCGELYAMVNTVSGVHNFLSLKNPRAPIVVSFFTLGSSIQSRSNIDSEYNIFVSNVSSNTIDVYRPRTCLSCANHVSAIERIQSVSGNSILASSSSYHYWKLPFFRNSVVQTPIFASPQVSRKSDTNSGIVFYCKKRISTLRMYATVSVSTSAEIKLVLSVESSAMQSRTSYSNANQKVLLELEYGPIERNQDFFFSLVCDYVPTSFEETCLVVEYEL